MKVPQSWLLKIVTRIRWHHTSSRAKDPDHTGIWICGISSTTGFELSLYKADEGLIGSF